jgi:hypothetical protein
VAMLLLLIFTSTCRYVSRCFCRALLPSSRPLAKGMRRRS